MKLTDIILKRGEIRSGSAQLFLAEKDFTFMGLPILKDSLVSYDGKSMVHVNMIPYGFFRESNVPEYITAPLPKDDDSFFLVENTGLCKYEMDMLQDGSRGIWHRDHFDEWTGKFSPYIDRIGQIPVLTYSGIEFSSLMYYFNAETKTLQYFINVSPVAIKTIKDKLIELPRLLEISVDKNEHTIIPLVPMVYFGILLKGFLTLSTDGILSGDCAEDFDAEILGQNNVKKVCISKGSQVEISSIGYLQIGLFNEQTHRVEKYRLRKCK